MDPELDWQQTGAVHAQLKLLHLLNNRAEEHAGDDGEIRGARILMQRHTEWAQEGVAEWYASGRKLEP